MLRFKPSQFTFLAFVFNLLQLFVTSYLSFLVYQAMRKTIEKGMARTPTWTFFNYILLINTCPNEPLRKISLFCLFGNCYIFNVGFLPDVNSILMYTKWYLAHLTRVKANDVFIGIYFIPIHLWRDISIFNKMVYYWVYMQYRN